MDLSIRRLLAGFNDFVARRYLEDSFYLKLVEEGQSPEICLIACSDSRVDPSLILGAKPGDLFVVRNVAALVPPYEPDSAYHGTSAALEFAIQGLRVKHVVVMGHERCGGIQALVDGEEKGGDFIKGWMSLARPALEASKEKFHDNDEVTRCCEQSAVRLSLENLRTFPWINEAEKQGRVALHGWYFDLRNGQLFALDEQTKNFSRIAGRVE